MDVCLPCRFETDRAMTRCSVCNAADFRVLTSEEAKEQVPGHVFEVRNAQQHNFHKGVDIPGRLADR